MSARKQARLFAWHTAAMEVGIGNANSSSKTEGFELGEPGAEAGVSEKKPKVFELRPPGAEAGVSEKKRFKGDKRWKIIFLIKSMRSI